MGTVQVQIKRLAHAMDLPLPQAQSAGAAGLDLAAAVDAPLVMKPGERTLIPTGLSVEIPAGYEGQVRPRSGNAIKLGLGLLNSPGTIDSDYRGEIKVICINLGQEPITISRGDRIAQMLIAPVIMVEWKEVGELAETTRGAGGFGHTGR